MVDSLDFLKKEWPLGFSTNQNLLPHKSYLEATKERLQKAKQPGDDLRQNDFAIFLGFDGVEGRYVYKDLLTHVGNKSVKSLGAASVRKGAWFDFQDLCAKDISESSDDTFVACESPLKSATELYDRLKNLELQEDEQLHANRQLILIEQLDVDYVLALTNTAKHIERMVLRDTITRHLLSKPAIKVTIQTTKLFQLELHIPYFILGDASLRPPTSRVKFGPRRKCFDVSFLRSSQSCGSDEPEYIIERHVAFAVWGTGNRRWTGCCLVDAHSDDGHPLASADDLDMMDPISNDESPATNHLTSPREYFLQIFKIRITIAQRSYEDLIHWLEARMDEHQSDPTSTRRTVRNNQKMCEWTRRMLELLHVLIEKITMIINIWEGFKQPAKGDIGYFLDIMKTPGTSCENTKLVIRDITTTMEEMEMQKQTLERLEKRCHGTTQIFQLSLGVDGDDTARHDSRRASLTIFFVVPLMAVLTLYTIPPESAPFKLHGKNFLFLIFVFMLLVQLLFIISQYIPAYSWWWQHIKRLFAQFRLFCSSICAFRQVEIDGLAAEEMNIGF